MILIECTLLSLESGTATLEKRHHKANVRTEDSLGVLMRWVSDSSDIRCQIQVTLGPFHKNS